MTDTNTAYPYVSVVQSIEDYPSYLQNIQKNISIQTYVPSNNQQYNINKNSKCYAENQSETVLNMVPFDEYLHTVDSCKFSAAVKQLNFNSNYSSSFSPENHGLAWDIYNEYFGSKTDSYIDPKSGSQTSPAYQTSGKAKNLSNIQNATGNTGIIMALVNSTIPFSVEWDGYFMPNTTGTWTFTINCEKSKASVFMWIGDVANSGYSSANANINITPSPAVANVFTYSSTFMVGNPYRIRIQYSSQSGKPSFNLVIKDPNGTETNGETSFVQNQDRKDMAYFALVEKDDANTERGLFKCYVADTTDPKIASQIAAPNTGFILQTIWQLFDPNDENPYLTDGNYLKNDGKTLCVYDKTGNIIYKMGDIGESDMVTFGGDYGDIFIGSKNVTNNAKTNPDLVAQKNPLFEKTYNKYKSSPSKNTDLSIIHIGDTIKCLSDYVLAKGHLSVLDSDNLDDYVRLTADGKFILFFSDGNLLVSTNNSPCATHNDSKYGKLYYSVNGSSSSSPSGFYPYTVDLENVNTNAHESYLVYTDPATKETKKNILAQAVVGSKMIVDDSSYFQYTDYIPQNMSDSTPLPKNQTSCKPSCDNNPSCNYYFTYQTADGQTYCNFDTDYSIPNFSPLSDEHETNILTSTLNVKNVSFKPDDALLKPSSMEREFYDNIPNEIITDTTILDKAVMDDKMTFDSLFKDLTEDYRIAINLANKLTLGLSPGDSIQDLNKELNSLLGKIKSKENFVSNIKEGMSNVKEGFYQDNGYLDGNREFVDGKLPEFKEVTAQGMIRDVIRNKLIPLEKTANQYSDMLKGVNQNYDTITKKLENIHAVRNYLNKNDKYDFSGNLLMGNKYDNSGVFKEYGLNNITIEDAVVEDTSNMVYRENTLYILGTITAAALIIAAISIAK